MTKEEVLIKAGDITVSRWESDSGFYFEIEYPYSRCIISISPSGEIEIGRLHKMSANYEMKAYVKDTVLAEKVKKMLSRTINDIDAFIEVFNKVTDAVRERQEEVEDIIEEKIDELAVALGELEYDETQLDFITSCEPREVVKRLLQDYFVYFER